MILNDLLEGRLQVYFDECLRSAPLWLFVHVPKTAGSSLNGELAPLLRPAHHIFIDYTKLGEQTFEELMAEAVWRFIGLAARRRFAYCTGHLTAEHVTRIAGVIANTRPVSLLRDPVARFVSDYRYQGSEMNVGHAQFRAAYPTIESYLELPGEWNKVAVHLVPYALRQDGDAQACIGFITQTFAFVGIQENYKLSLRLLTTLAGAPRRPAVFRRVNTPTPETEVRLTPETRARIQSRNALDTEIYNHFASRFRAATPAIEAYLDAVNPLPPEA